MSNKKRARFKQGLPRVWFPGAARKMYPSILGWLSQFAGILASLLQEIFDESAYHRFLERNQISSSTTAYAAFQEENDRWRAQRPKCC
jgi:hypothetical protein